MSRTAHEFVNGKTFWLSCGVCGLERDATTLHQVNQPPLNPDAVDRVAKALMDDAGYTWGNATEKFRDGFRHHARIALAAALPEVTSVESIPAKMRMLMWEGGEVEVGEIPDGYVLVGFEMETDRAWSMADKVTINIERPDVTS